MGVDVDKPIINTPLSAENLAEMAYDQLNRIYPDTVKVSVDGHTSYFGGAKKPWSNLNEIKKNGVAKTRVIDSDVFAVFHTQRSLGTQFQESPWKIHLSIHPGDLAEAWDLIYPLLLAKHIPIFKTTRNSVAQKMLYEVSKLDAEQLEALHLSSYDKELAMQDMLRVFNGMQITIYIEEGQEAQYNALLQEIEPLLYKAGIRPGIIDKSDRALGLYSSIRHVGKSYTSHEKVTGYKALGIADEFKAIKLDWHEIQINWADFDYAKHISKASLTLQQVIDAQKKYEMAIISKREFIQACEVAAEYFTRWHKLLKKTAQPLDLSEKKQESFFKFKKWIDEGKDLVPTIKKQKTRKIKEAEDILDFSTKNEKKQWKFHLPLERHNAHRNLRTLLPEGMALAPKKSIYKGSNTADILARLDERRKKEFAEIKSQSLANIPRQIVSSVMQEEAMVTTSTPVANSGALEVTTETTAPDYREQERFLASNRGRLLATIVGLGLGLMMGLIFVTLPPVIFIMTLLGTALVGGLLGFMGGYYLDKYVTQELIKPEIEQSLLVPENADVPAEKSTKQLAKNPEEIQWTQRKASSLPLHRFKELQEWEPRMFGAEKPKDKADEAPVRSTFLSFV